MMTDEMPEVIRTSLIAALLDHDMQATGGQAGEFLQCLPNKRQIGIDAGWTNRADTRQSGLAQYTCHTAVVNVKLPRNGAVAPFLNVVVAKYFGFNVGW